MTVYIWINSASGWLFKKKSEYRAFIYLLSYNMFRPVKIYKPAIILNNCDAKTNVIAHISIYLLVFCTW